MGRKYRKRRWAQEEEDYLRQNFGKLDTRIMAENLKRGYKATYNRCYQLGLSKTGTPSSWKRWTQEEKDFLKKNYVHLTNREIAKKLGRSINSVMGMARILGVKKKRGRRKSTCR